MKIAYSRRALAELDEILSTIGRSSPSGSERVRARFEAVAKRISTLPEGAQEVRQRPGVRRVPLIRYPYSIYYKVGRTEITILRIRHDARRQW
jgi:toxin ParE1/3/4